MRRAHTKYIVRCLRLDIWRGSMGPNLRAGSRSALAHVRRAHAVVNPKDTADGAEHKKKDAALNPNAVQQFGVGKGTLSGRKQRDADLSSPTQTNQRRSKQCNARRPENAHRDDRLHGRIVPGRQTLLGFCDLVISRFKKSPNREITKFRPGLWVFERSLRRLPIHSPLSISEGFRRKCVRSVGG